MRGNVDVLQYIGSRRLVIYQKRVIFMSKV